MQPWPFYAVLMQTLPRPLLFISWLLFFIARNILVYRPTLVFGWNRYTPDAGIDMVPFVSSLVSLLGAVYGTA